MKVIPKGLEIKKTQCVRVTNNKFTLECYFGKYRNDFNASITGKRCSYPCATIQRFFDQIKDSLSNAISINDIRNLLEKFIVEENQLFDCRITKFVKVAKQPDIRDLRKRMQILRPLSKDLHELCLTQAGKLHHITTRKKRRTEQHLIGNEV